MTVQDLIDKLNELPDKEMEVVLARDSKQVHNILGSTGLFGVHAVEVSDGPIKVGFDAEPTPGKKLVVLWP
jgi:hypothetical protein